MSYGFEKTSNIEGSLVSKKLSEINTDSVENGIKTGKEMRNNHIRYRRARKKGCSNGNR